MRNRIKAADRFNLVAEELHPHRLLATRREYVEDAAADRIFARHLHRLPLFVAHAFQVGCQIFQRNLFVDSQHKGELPVKRRVIHPGEGGRNRHHDDTRLSQSQFAQSLRAGGQNVRVR